MCYIDYGRICPKCGKYSSPGAACVCGEPIYINTRCNICGEKNTLLEPCRCNKKVETFGDVINIVKPSEFKRGDCTVKIDPEDTKDDLRDLYDELGKLKWVEDDIGWDDAIKAVRDHIRKQL